MMPTSVAGLLGFERLASLGASMLVNAMILTAGGPFLGGPRITTAPPSMTCFTTPLKYCLGAARAAAVATGALTATAKELAIVDLFSYLKLDCEITING